MYHGALSASSSVEVRLPGMVWCKSSEAAQNPILVVCMYIRESDPYMYIYIYQMVQKHVSAFDAI